MTLLLLPSHPPTHPAPQLVEAAKRQGLMITWNTGTVHFMQLAYETMNDMLLNIMCPVPAG